MGRKKTVLAFGSPEVDRAVRLLAELERKERRARRWRWLARWHR